jgi:phosphate-selective porin OprO/OprP
MNSHGCWRWLRAAFAAMLALSVPGAALAQGMYYKEIVKEGRIYVFNDAKNAAAFEAGGEMGRSVTRVGVGPNGETVIGDSEMALELYFFKHGIAELVERPKPPTQRIEWRDGKTRITTDNAYLEISNRVQVRYTHDIPDDSRSIAGTAAAGDSVGSFRIRRAKFKLEGWVFKDNITYELQMNWPAVTGSNPGAFLEDAYLGWDPGKKGTFKVMFGQNKVAFGHQELTSSGSQIFVDRSEVSNQYSRGRDTGLSVIGVLWGNKLEYRAGVYNGNGLTRTANDNDAFQYNARLMWQVAGDQPLKQRAWVSGVYYSEGDFESTDKPLVALAANFESNNFHRTTTSNDLKDKIFGLDGTFKYKGVFATAEYYIRDRNPETGSSFDSNGWFGQLAYNFGPARKWAVAGRYGMFDPSDLVDNNDRKEWRVGLSYFYSRHTLKVQADFGQLEDEAANSGKGTKNKEFRLQTQVIF